MANLYHFASILRTWSLTFRFPNSSLRLTSSISVERQLLKIELLLHSV